MDARVRVTKLLLRDALFKCMRSKPLREITVTELCVMADVNRATFYKHYKDCYEVMAEAEQEQLDTFRTLMRENRKDKYRLLVAILDSVDSAKEIYRSIDGVEMPESFKNGLIAIAKEYGLQEWKDSLPKVDEFSAEISFEALLAGTLHAVLAMGERVSNEKKATLILDMIEAYIRSRA